MNFKLHKDESGFTLIELMATLAILALIVVIAVPSIGKLIANADEKSEATSIAMIENGGSIADVAGLEHDRDEAYDVITLIEEGYLDMDTDDDLIDGYVIKTGSGNAYVYNGMGEEEEVVVESTDASMFTWSSGAGGYTVMGFSDERPDDLTDIVIPDTYEGEPVVSIGEIAFADNNLTSVTLPDTLTSINMGAFAYNNLTFVALPDGLTSTGDAAFGYNNLTSVTIPDSVTSIGAQAFYNNQLTSVTIPDSVTSIGHSAFLDNNLTSVTIPDSVTSIEGYAFYNNPLTSVTIPNSVTSIGTYAFYNNNFTSVTIPDSVTIIGAHAFYGNAGLTIHGLAGSAASRYSLQSGQSFVEVP